MREHYNQLSLSPSSVLLTYMYLMCIHVLAFIGARIDVGKSSLATQQNLSQLMESIDNSEDPVLANKWLKVSFPYPICLRKLSAQIIPKMSKQYIFQKHATDLVLYPVYIALSSRCLSKLYILDNLNAKILVK